MRRPFNLSGDDFYPLTQVRHGELTYDQKIKYRARHGIPRTIDQWIELAKGHILAPTGDLNGHNCDPSLEYLLWEDDVECVLKVIHKEVCGQKTYVDLDLVKLIISQGAMEGPTQHPDEFTLTLHLRIPPTSGFLMFYWHSPVVVIDKYTGNAQDTVAPDWLQTVQIERRFWQRRALMLKMLIHFVHNIPQKERVMSRVACWCRAMSVSNIISTESIHTIDGPIIDTCIWPVDLYPSRALRQSHLATQYASIQASHVRSLPRRVTEAKRGLQPRSPSWRSNSTYRTNLK